MRKILETGITVCSSCGEGLDGVLIDYEQERNEAEPDCDVCAINKDKKQQREKEGNK
jgi:hypothetical protein